MAWLRRILPPQCYGVSATPTYALIDRKGAAPFYSPTRFSEFELSRRIEAVWDRP